MVKFKLPSQGFNSFVDEVSTLITHEDLRAYKPCYDILKNELRSCSFTIILSYSCFCPSGQILYHSDNISISCAPS
jgi:hypothetical protein